MGEVLGPGSSDEDKVKDIHPRRCYCRQYFLRRGVLPSSVKDKGQTVGRSQAEEDSKGVFTLEEFYSVCESIPRNELAMDCSLYQKR